MDDGRSQQAERRGIVPLVKQRKKDGEPVETVAEALDREAADREEAWRGFNPDGKLYGDRFAAEALGRYLKTPEGSNRGAGRAAAFVLFTLGRKVRTGKHQVHGPQQVSMGYTSIAEGSGLSVRGAKEGVRTLALYGYLQWLQGRGGNSDGRESRPNKYRIICPPMPPAAVEEWAGPLTKVKGKVQRPKSRKSGRFAMGEWADDDRE